MTDEIVGIENIASRFGLGAVFAIKTHAVNKDVSINEAHGGHG